KHRHITYDLGGRGHLHDIPQKLIGDPVIFLDRIKFLLQTQTPRLRSQVGILTTGYLVAIYAGRARPKFGLEWVVIRPNDLPVIRESIEAPQIDVPTSFLPLEGSHHRIEIGLTGQPRHRTQGDVHDVYSSFNCFEISG